MRNTLAPCVQVELFRPGSDVPAVVGTDYVVFIDGRWSQDRAVTYVEEAGYAAARRSGLEWRRSVYLLGGRYRSASV